MLIFKGFEKAKGYYIESEVSKIEGNDEKNWDNMKETEETTMMVEDQNKLYSKQKLM